MLPFHLVALDIKLIPTLIDSPLDEQPQPQPEAHDHAADVGKVVQVGHEPQYYVNSCNIAAVQKSEKGGE